MTSDDFSFDEVTVKDGEWSITFEYIGEGWSGDYDPEDPEDEPLVRFYVQHNGEDINDGSYCTRLNAAKDQDVLEKAGKIILREVSGSIYPKKTLEGLSWISRRTVNG